MTNSPAPTSASSKPGTNRAKPTGFRSQPIVKVVAYVVSWFIFATSFGLLGYASLAVSKVGGICASGNTPYRIRVQCPQLTTDFLPWAVFTLVFAILLGALFASGIGMQLRIWTLPILFCSFGALFLAAGGVGGWLIGILFLAIGLVPLVLQLRADLPETFVGSRNIYFQGFKPRPNAKPAFSVLKAPKLADAVEPTSRDWAIALVGFAVPAFIGLLVATIWVDSITNR